MRQRQKKSLERSVTGSCSFVRSSNRGGSQKSIRIRPFSRKERKSRHLSSISVFREGRFLPSSSFSKSPMPPGRIAVKNIHLSPFKFEKRGFDPSSLLWTSVYTLRGYHPSRQVGPGRNGRLRLRRRRPRPKRFQGPPPLSRSKRTNVGRLETVEREKKKRRV